MMQNVAEVAALQEPWKTREVRTVCTALLGLELLPSCCGAEWDNTYQGASVWPSNTSELLYVTVKPLGKCRLVALHLGWKNKSPGRFRKDCIPDTTLM